MNPIAWFKFNIRIIQAFNSCNPTKLQELFTYIMTELSEKQQYRVFKRKRYVWNIIRPRDFYRLASIWVTNRISEDKLVIAEKLIKLILATTKNETACKNFIWVITKRCPLITIDTIQYITPEKVHSLLTGDKQIICDVTMQPFVDEVLSLRAHVESLEILTSM